MVVVKHRHVHTFEDDPCCGCGSRQAAVACATMIRGTVAVAQTVSAVAFASDRAALVLVAVIVRGAQRFSFDTALAIALTAAAFSAGR